MVKRAVALICVTAVALCAAASAQQQSTFKKGDHGLSDVVKRECRDIRWTSEVMMLSKIDSSELSLLKVGRTITVPNSCATLAPSKKIQKATLRIFKQEKLLLQVRKGGLPPNLNETKITKKSFEVAVNNAANKALQPLTIENAKLSADKIAAESKEKFEKGKNSSAKWKGAAISGVLGAIIATLVYWFLIKRLRKNSHNLSEKISSLEEDLKTSNEKQQQLRLKISSLEEDLKTSNEKQQDLQLKIAQLIHRQVRTSSIQFHGRKVDFIDTSEYWRGCPFCSEKRIKPSPQNMYAHLLKSHVHLRVDYITPKQMIKKLAGSIELFA